MENVFLSSFGVFLALLLKCPPKRNLQICRTVSVILSSKETDMNLDKKKKGKKKRHQKVEEMEEHRHNEKSHQKIQQVIAKSLEKEAEKIMRREVVEQEITALRSYFLDELLTIIPYNGQFGQYKLVIPIPGNTYSSLPIQIKLGTEYPKILPEMTIDKRNLLPIEREKLNNIIQQQKKNFFNEKNYRYILNLCTTIFQQIVYIVQHEQQEVQEQKAPQKINKPVMDLNDKEIFQSFLQQIFENHENEQVQKGPTIKVNQQYHRKHQSSRGRYANQFEQLQKIGEGGFGRVYKVKNRVDSNIYAVKKLVINYGDTQSRKMLKQVALLSKLNHPNIVRYYQSWLEDTTSVQQLIDDMSITDSDEIEEFNKIWLSYARDHNMQKMISEYEQDEESIMFCDDIVYDNSDIVFLDASTPEQPQKEISVEEVKLYQKSSEVLQFPFKILYVVMEYCPGMTLKQFINKRFNERNETKVKIIRGILEGLSYIHSRRIIHRDLKPPNIFLMENNKVKIGDFGLATVGTIESNPYEQEIVDYTDKTRGVGTSFYRAPEQLKSTDYGQKVDIYSLGIIMLELFYQFDTNMERFQVLNRVSKTQSLPKDFGKYQYNIDHEEHISACLSESPGDRPSVENLLQTFRNKYFTHLVSLIANPNHLQFYQLLKNLFTIKNQFFGVMKQNLFRKYLTDQLIKIYQTHRGILFIPLSLVPVSNFDSLNGVNVPLSRQNKFLMLSERGVILEYPSNAYTSWIRYAKQTMRRLKKGQTQPLNNMPYGEFNEEMRRYSFEKVAEFIGGDMKSQYSFKEKYVTAFDIAYCLEDGQNQFFLCECLKISDSMVKSLNLTQTHPTIYLCHSLIFRCLSKQYHIDEESLYKFLLSTSEEKFSTMSEASKLHDMKKFNIETNAARKIIHLMKEQYLTGELMLESLKLMKLAEASEIGFQAEALENIIHIFGLKQRIVWKLQIPPPNSYGIFWNIGPVKGFTSRDEFLPGTQLSNIHIETSINIGGEEKEADVSIWSNGGYLQEEIMDMVNRCWEEGVSAKWYDKGIGEKDLSCRNNLILKKKIDRIYLMVRKNVNMNLLEKKYSDEKEDRQPSFIPRQNFNYDVIKTLSRDYHKKYLH